MKRLAAALNFELPQGQVPDWIELVPAGKVIVGRDGRRWMNDRPEAIVEAFAAAGRDIVADFEHATEIKAPIGDQAPASGWIDQVELRDGAVWGHVAWNETGRNAIESKEYRYYSPAFLYEKTTGRIREISSVGLTNRPNLRVKALNHQLDNEEDPIMLDKILKALGLTEDTTEAQALNAIGAMKTDLATALNRAQMPDLEKFVPRADHDAALARANNAEQVLDQRTKADLERDITAAVDSALQAGKIVPATKDYYTAMCRQEGGLDSFQKFVTAAPVIGDPSKLGGTPLDTGTALNSEQKQIADMFGNSAEDIAKYGK